MYKASAPLQIAFCSHTALIQDAISHGWNIDPIKSS
jgi:hypothetical protein